jgi:adenylate cyclase
MGTEIERKFLVDEALLRPQLQDGVAYCQGYLADNARMAVRVRIAGDQGWLTIKGVGEKVAQNLVVRPEFEYAIGLDDAREMLETLVSGPTISKTRYLITHGQHVWEVDVFEGDNAGLIVAEVELDNAQSTVQLPDWVTEEVSLDPRYLNVNLAKHPFKQW